MRRRLLGGCALTVGALLLSTASGACGGRDPATVADVQSGPRAPAVGALPRPLQLTKSGRKATAIMEEIIAVQKLMLDTAKTDPSYVTIALRLASSYEDLEYTSAEEAEKASSGEAREKAVARSRKARSRVIFLDRLVIGRPDPYVKLDEVLYRLALEYESRPVFDLDGEGERIAQQEDADAARATYEQLVRTLPTSALAPDVRLRLADLAFADALHGSARGAGGSSPAATKVSFETARDAYRRTIEACGTSCRVLAYAKYRLGFCLWNLGDPTNAKAAFEQVIALARADGTLPLASEMESDAKRALGEL
jgi:tetratricopeptide (TPR) repeat protein